MEKKYRGLVIGCGLAGFSRPEGNHAACYADDPRCDLLGVMDTDPDRAGQAADALGVVAYPDIEAALNDNPDIISLAIHPAFRMDYLKKIVLCPGVKAVFCEKPLAYSSEEALETVNLCREAGKLFCVNFQRRGNKTYEQLAGEFRDNARGPVQNAVFYYMRGMWANASHYIDLCLLFYGKPDWIYAHKSPIPSPYPGDYNASIILGYGAFLVHLIPLLSWDKAFYSGSHDFIFEKGRLFIPNNSFYKDEDVKCWEVKEQILQGAPPGIKLHKDKNDYLPMLDKIIRDMECGGGTSIPDPLEAVWGVKILEAAALSIEKGQGINIPKSLSGGIGKC